MSERKRYTQRKNESDDLFAMRVCVEKILNKPANVRTAAIQWLLAKHDQVCRAESKDRFDASMRNAAPGASR